MVETLKKNTQAIRTMFDSISPRYDLLNRILSFGIDIRWRKKLVSRLKIHAPENVVDLATGTGDLAIEIARKIDRCHVFGIDLSPGMLEYARKKIAKHKLHNRISLIEVDGHNIPFEDNFFSAATIAFGIRNYENPAQGIKEIFRVLKPGGILMILEFNMPQKGIFAKVYRFYFFRILPTIGRIVSGNKNAYTYLPASVTNFNTHIDLNIIMNQCHFENIAQEPHSFGIVSIYSANKPKYLETVVY